MDNPRVSTANVRGHSGAGIISKIHLENFMCHSSLDIEFDDYVNFITGQNGSGKSAILTALCVAFGCRAKGTQRAAALKDFIKTGCSYALVSVEVKNQGDDAFKPEIYGDLIRIERRILESSSTTTLKDHQGKKVSHRKDELHELVDHFNIDVENPCVIMSQDKSREFLHSGNDKEKFKFFFKATLLQQVNELLQNIRVQLDAANATVEELESSIRPILKELNDLQVKIKNIEHVEEISQKLQQLKKKLAWSWVYDIQQQMLQQGELLQKLKDRIPTCQARIDSQQVKMDRLEGELLEKKNQVALLVDKTSEVRSMKDKLQDELSLATKERLELEEDCKRRTNAIRKMSGRVKQLEQQIHDIQQQHMRSTQAHEYEIEEQLKSMQEVVDSVNLNLERLQEEENALSEQLTIKMNAIKEINVEIEENEKKYRDIYAYINELQQQRTNKVTAFGGSRVIRLLHSIEKHHRRFNKPPIGPIGAHLALVNDDIWAVAIENAVGKLLNAFIVTDHKDALLLRQCAKEANYQHLQIIIYDFSRPRLNIPYHMLPQTDHPTVLSVLHTDNPTIVNVLVDQGDAERQVLVRDYEVGKSVVFEKRIPNLKEVYTLEGYRMFSKGTVQTVLPPNKRLRTGRLCSSIEGQINGLEKDASKVQELVRNAKGKKRSVEEVWQDLQGRAQTTKVMIAVSVEPKLYFLMFPHFLFQKRRLNVEKDLMSKKITLQDLKDSSEATSVMEPNVDELNQEILKVQEEIQEKELSLQMLREKMAVAEAKANDLKLSFETLCESVKVERDALAEAEKELFLTVEGLGKATSEKAHYENIMKERVLHDIKVADTAHEDLQNKHQESYRKASIICPESEVEALGGCAGNTPEQLSAQVNRLNQRLQQETERYPESIDDLRLAYEKKERKIKRKQQIYKAFHDKLNACQKALDLRWSKFQRNATFLKQQLTWQFNGHLRRKGISGQIKVNYEDKTLSIEVKMPHDASSNTVRDTRGLSGGERSFSTLCFALALHEMTESPLRAMDEFDVFMDAVSRKISLDTLVDFAVTQGSQWIIITPNDISMVKPGERVKKQQMAAPRV